MTKPLDPDQLERDSALVFSDAWAAAHRLGHNLEPGWHDTAPASWVAQCGDCLKWLCVDFSGDMGREPFGLVDLLCAPPQHGPALRHSQEWLAAHSMVMKPTPPRTADAWLPPVGNQGTGWDD
jgi:hypothetical protein